MKPFSDWYFLNISKRLHRNDFEHLVTVVPLSILNGLVFPWTTVGLLGVYLTGRVIYTKGYQEKEGAFNKMRIAGSIMVNLSHIATIGLAGLLAYRMIRGTLCL